MKPIILLCGPPHCYSSMTAKFLLDHGAITGECKKGILYPTYEDRFVANWVKKGRIQALRTYLNKMPADKTIIFKVGGLSFAVKRFLKATDRYVKIVMLIRNPRDVSMSSMEKWGGNFIQYFNRYCSHYDALLNLDVPFMPFITERIQYDGWQLLAFCELYRTPYKYRKLKPREFNLIHHRCINFFFKHLGKLL